MEDQNILEYEGFIVYMCNKIYKICPSVEFEDLIQEAWLNLLKHWGKHDPERGSMITFLYYVIFSKLMTFCKTEISNQQLQINNVEDLDFFQTTHKSFDTDLWLDIKHVQTTTGIKSDLKLLYECQRRGVL